MSAANEHATAMKLCDLIDYDELLAMIASGHIGVQQHPSEPLSILNYTHACQYDRVWSPTTRQCRGLIIHERGLGLLSPESDVIARPWPKFFNYGELERDNPAEVAILLDAPCHVTDKLDGSLGILYPTHIYRDPIYDPRPEDRGVGSVPEPAWGISTRGSFTSEQALHATQVYRERYAGFEPDPRLTYLFEIIYPANRIVIDYGDQDDLVLLGAVETATGKIYGSTEVYWPGRIASAYPGFATLREALAARPRRNAEGLVVRFEHGEQLKLKQEDYVALHRIVTGLNERVVWERLGAGETHDDICVGLPDEFEAWVKEVGTRLILDAERAQRDARIEFNNVVDDLAVGGKPWALRKTREYRAAFAAHAQHSHPTMRPYLFMLLDGKNIWPAIWRGLKPSGQSAPRSFTEATA